MIGLRAALLGFIKRIAEPAAHVVQDLAVRVGLEIDDVSLRELISHAEGLRFTRDPFDA